MSKELLTLAAQIRDENKESANTAMRVGQLFERMIQAFDAFAARFPETRIPALVIDIADLDSMNTSDFVRVDSRGVGSHYIVTRKTSSGVPISVGTLDVFSDGLRHVITQVFRTHELLSKEGTFQNDHDHNHLYVYTRSYGLTMESQVVGPSSFPLGGWGKWRPMTAISPDEETGPGMDGLMSALDKKKLYTLEREVKALKDAMNELRKITLITT